jgi:hypothetical protein
VVRRLIDDEAGLSPGARFDVRVEDRIAPRASDEPMMAHEPFALHACFLHHPAGGDVPHIGSPPDPLEGEVFEPEREHALEGFRGVPVAAELGVYRVTHVTLTMIRLADADPYCSDEPRRCSDLNREVPVHVRVGLAPPPRSAPRISWRSPGSGAAVG